MVKNFCMRYRCIIVDNEPLSANILSKYIEAVPVLELINTCTNSLEAFNLILSQEIDLIFLDNEMPDLPGIDLVKALQRPPAIIFTTANREFAIEAFDLDAIDYLLKPVSFERFLKAINRLPQNLSERRLEMPETTTNHMYFHINRKMVKVILDNILYIECLKDYVLIHRLNEPELRIKHTFNTLESILPNHMFLRIHRSFIVSKSRITAFSKDFVEIGKLEIPIGRKYRNVAAALTAG